MSKSMELASVEVSAKYDETSTLLELKERPGPDYNYRILYDNSDERILLEGIKHATGQCILLEIPKDKESIDNALEHPNATFAAAVRKQELDESLFTEFLWKESAAA